MNIDTQQIHDASIRLLEDPGIRLEHDGICELMLKAGARSGSDCNTVRIPSAMIDDILAGVPSTVALGAREASYAHTVSCNSKPVVWSVPGMNILRDRKLRPFLAADMAYMAALLDALPNVSGVFGMSMADVAPTKRDVVGLRIMAENTAKHIRVLCFTPKGVAFLKSMFAVFEGNWFSLGFTSHGPLRWTNLALSVFAESAGAGIPVSVNGEPMAGASGPVTIAGSAAVANAEIIAGIIVNQLLEPGRPCLYNMGLAHLFDMRTAIAVTGAPENHLFATISAAMGRHYNMPSCSWVSTESMLVDSQAGLEKGIGYFTHMNAGVSVIWGAGQLESELTISPAQAVIDNEIIGYVGRFLRGAEVDSTSLAVDLIREVGISGSFLETEHTLENFRNQQWQPEILCRSRRAIWEAHGARDLAQHAEAEAERLVNSRQQQTQRYFEECAALRELASHFERNRQ